MMRMIVIFVLLLISVWLGIQLSHDPGYVLLSLHHWTIETTAWVAIIILLISFIILHVFIQLCHRLGRGPLRFQHWMTKRKQLKSQNLTRQGFIEFSEGYWLKAQKNLIKALPNAKTPLLNYLTAARAAQKLGNLKLRDHYLREAQHSMPEAKIAVELTQAQLQIANHQWEQALATLRHLQDLVPNHPYVIKLLISLCEEVRDWAQLMHLLPQAKRHQILTDAHYKILLQKACVHHFSDLLQQSNHQQISEFLENLPKHLRYDPDIVILHAQYLWQNNKKESAEQLLRRGLQKSYHVKLIEQYGRLIHNSKQLNFAESLLKKYPHCPQLLLCCARHCIAQQLWGKARHYLEQNLLQQPTPQAYFTLGNLLENLHEINEAMNAYKAGLELQNKTIS